MPRIFRTTAFRVSVLYAIVFSLLSLSGLATVYVVTINRIDAHVDEQLQLETLAIINRLSRGDYQAQELSNVLRHKNSEAQLDNTYFFRIQSLRNRQSVIPNNQPVTVTLADFFGKDLPKRELTVPVRALATPFNQRYRIVVGNRLEDEQALRGYFWRLMLLVLLATFTLSLLCSLILGRYTLFRIDHISRTTRAIMNGKLSQRIPLPKRYDEFHELGNNLNSMLDKLEDLMLGMRQVTDNIAHDLRKPLNRLRSRLEITLLEDRGNDEYVKTLQNTLQDIDELLRTFNALLSIAQAEAGVKRNEWRSFSLNNLVTDLAELYDALAEEAQLQFTYQPAKAPLQACGNRSLVAQAISNLLENAIKYTPKGGAVTLSLQSSGQWLQVIVADNGPGIPLDQHEEVIKRFVRLDSARTNPGNGLGLSLVKAVSKLHRGRLRLDNNNPGLCITLELPNAEQGNGDVQQQVD